METKRRKLSHLRLVAVLPDELVADIALVDVYAALISDPRNISKVIVEINEKLPVADLQHLKRMKGREILLFPSSWIDRNTDDSEVTSSEAVFNYLTSRNISTDFFDAASVKVASVASIPPKTRRQYTVINKLWPCNFHSNKYLENLVENTLFTTKDLDLHQKCLKLAVELSKKSISDASGMKCGVIVTDPLRNDVIISAGYTLTGKNPILHAAMLAIDGVARTQNGGAYTEYPIDIDWEDMLRDYDLKVLRRPKESEAMNNSTSNNDIVQSINLDDSEYLCTNYHVYMTHEPCAMCAMALVHSRAKRVFYIYPSQNGALGSNCKIHAVKDLNHHYEVFRVLTDDLYLFQGEN